MLICHCGRKADISRKENALSHWSSKFCKSETLTKAAAGGGIKSFFTKNTVNANEPEPKRQRINGPTIYPCVGLNDISWERKRAKPEHTIKAYVMASPSVFHGHPPRHKLAEEYFEKSYTKLTNKEKEELQQIMIATSKWRLIRSDDVACIRSTKCTSMVQLPGNVEKDKVVCHECWRLRKEPVLVEQLNRTYASKDTQKYIQNAYLEQDYFRHLVIRRKELKHIAQSIEKVASREDAMNGDDPK
ncbi:hypothetical protein BKA69DRAFT_1078664 [Paraphysoderma sedebokerense]|nr:hypothetical protein BKA69DRAFT_1078664 [Paraphysoderma sedebokerense]